jgi:hypothetical protein
MLVFRGEATQPNLLELAGICPKKTEQYQIAVSDFPPRLHGQKQDTNCS